MIRAVICDVYHTLLEVLPPPADADGKWRELTARHLGEVPCSLGELTMRCREIVAQDHAAAKTAGVLFPEVVWPAVMERALPGLKLLAEPARGEFLFEHMQLLRELRLMPGAGEVLNRCADQGLLLGIASNAQRYTLRELQLGLAETGLTTEIFDPELCLWSWQLGFSKPNPHVFQILTARLAHRGIAPGEILMIGDRADNDIEPACAFGWQAFRIERAEDWRGVRELLFRKP